MNIILRRLSEDNYGTHGRFEYENGVVICQTIERRWYDNQRDISCIPDGTYGCVPHVKSNNGQECWLLNNVPDRSGVLIHTGNTENDSEGCIIIGLVATPEGVEESALALEKLHTLLPSDFTLAVISNIS
jgi:hypothetical protein